MSRDPLGADEGGRRSLTAESVSLQDMEALRLFLQGSSVIDWNRLQFQELAEVDQFLSLLFVDMDTPEGARRLRFVFNEAANYIEEHLDLRLPKDLRNPEDVRQVFLDASSFQGRRFRRRQVLNCTLLKLMHVIAHMEAAELKFQARVSEAELLERAANRIRDHADHMRAQGFPLRAFYGSRKTRTSTITKLLAKRETIAATIFDKLRFRIVTERPEDLLPTMAYLCRTLFPFNYLIPDQSHNNLVPFRRVLRDTPHYAELAGDLQKLRRTATEWIAENNPFSGTTYRTVNFIVDFPVPVWDSEHPLPPAARHHLGSTVFVMVEFQLVDRETAHANEEGENAHALYKERQKRQVESRLIKGSLARLRG